MLSFAFLATSLLAALAIAEPAPEVADSPRNVVYTATFNDFIQGEIRFFSTNGTVAVDVNLAGFPTVVENQYIYRIHERPVPANGSCDATLRDFNPYNGTVNASRPALMEVGDLSGKHGRINGTSIRDAYLDSYLSLNPSNEAYIGNRSVAIHFLNGTRPACASIIRRNVPTPSAAARVLGKCAAVWPLAAGLVAVFI